MVQLSCWHGARLPHAAHGPGARRLLVEHVPFEPAMREAAREDARAAAAGPAERSKSASICSHWLLEGLFSCQNSLCLQSDSQCLTPASTVTTWTRVRMKTIAQQRCVRGATGAAKLTAHQLLRYEAAYRRRIA